MTELARHLPKGFNRPIVDLTDWELDALERVAETRAGVIKTFGRRPKGAHWAVAQTVSKMEHIARRDIEKTNHGAFLPTYARHWKVDGVQHSKEHPLFTGYVFFLTKPDDYAGIPDIHGVYRVLSSPSQQPDEGALASPVSPDEMQRLFMGCALNRHTEVAPPRYTKYYRGERPTRKTSRKPRPGKRIRNAQAA